VFHQGEQRLASVITSDTHPPVPVHCLLIPPRQSPFLSFILSALPRDPKRGTPLEEVEEEDGPALTNVSAPSYAHLDGPKNGKNSRRLNKIMDVSQGHTTRRRRSTPTSKSRSRSRLTLDAPAHRTSTFLLQLLVCILSASTLATAQTHTETDPELAGDEASCLFGVDQKEINRLFSEGQLSFYLDHIGLSIPPPAFGRPLILSSRPHSQVARRHVSSCVNVQRSTSPALSSLQARTRNSPPRVILTKTRRRPWSGSSGDGVGRLSSQYSISLEAFMTFLSAKRRLSYQSAS
jgi:hypothetical protein